MSGNLLERVPGSGGAVYELRMRADGPLSRYARGRSRPQRKRERERHLRPARKT